MRLAQGGKLAATLGGSMVSAGGRAIRLYRESGRGFAAPLELAPGDSAVWDRRFRVSLERGGTLQGEEVRVTVKALGLAGYTTLKAGGVLLPSVPVRAALGLPSFWIGSTLIAVPQLNVQTSVEPAARACRVEFVGWQGGAD